MRNKIKHHDNLAYSEMRDYNKITKPTPQKYCTYCGALLERKRYNGRLEDLSTFNRRKYCGRECMKRAFVKKDATNQNWEDSHHSARMIAYMIEEREKVCEICGSKQNVDVHHKDGNYRNNTSKNLVLVCRSCHNKLHRQKSVCTICGKPVKGHGYCNMHYIRWKKYGDPLVYQGQKVSPNFTERR